MGAGRQAAPGGQQMWERPGGRVLGVSACGPGVPDVDRGWPRSFTAKPGHAQGHRLPGHSGLLGVRV